jgi:hypothetical protein
MFRGSAIKAFFTVAPIFGVGILGAYNQTARDMPVAPEYGPLTHGRITAYAQAVRASSFLVANKTSPATLTETKRIAGYWITEYRKGNLRDLPQVAPDDTARTGVKSEILTARNAIQWHLSRNAATAIQAGDKLAATECLVTLIELADVCRRSDIVFMLQSNAAILSSLTKIQENDLRLSNDQVRRISAVIQDHREVEQTLSLVNTSWASSLQSGSKTLSATSRQRLNQWVVNPTPEERKKILRTYGPSVMGQSILNSRAYNSAVGVEQRWIEVKRAQMPVVASSVAFGS